MQVYFSNNTPKYIRVFTYFAMREIGMTHLRGKVDIHWKGTIEGECFGLCWGDNREAEIHIATKQWGAPVSRQDRLMTLAHELVHAKQYLKRELAPSDEEGYVSRWHGVDVPYDPEAEQQMPWEVEAASVEKPIYNKWVDATGYK